MTLLVEIRGQREREETNIFDFRVLRASILFCFLFEKGGFERLRISLEHET